MGAWCFCVPRIFLCTCLGFKQSAQGKLDEAKTEANAAAQEVGKLFKTGQKDKAELLREKTKELKATIASLEQTMREANDALNAHWIQLPNLAFDEVPEGKNEEDNQEIRRSDRPCKEASAPHWEIAERLNLLRMDLGVKLSRAVDFLFMWEAWLSYNVDWFPIFWMKQIRRGMLSIKFLI